MGDVVPVTDPRPTVVTCGQEHLVAGVRCSSCGHPSAFERPRCAVCSGDVAPTRFGPGGQVWSATVVRIPTPGRTPPYALAYVDLEDGPRVLAHVAAASDPPAVGTHVRLVAATADGDLRVEVAR